MSDKQPPQPDDAAPGGGDQPDWRSAQTGRFDPVRDDATRQVSGAPGGDATRPMDAVGGDATRPMGAAGAADQTRAMPPAGDDPAWSGRAQVRGPQPPVESTSIGGYAPAGDPDPGRKWWLPILLGVLALLVVAALIWAGWLITRSSGADDPEPGTSPAPASVAPSSAAPSPTPSPSRNPSPSPTVEPPAAAIPVPPLVGLNQADAVRSLDALGLGFRVSYAAGDAPAGTVLSSDPKEGTEVKPGTDVKIVVVKNPASPSVSASAADQLPVEE